MISAAIITYNEELNIERCLQSVQWVDEIIVVDAFSSDRTVEIAQKLKAKIFQQKWDGYVKQKLFALQQATHEWVFSLDADEEITVELKDELLRIIQREDSADGYEVPRKSFFLGQWVQHGGWYPGYQMRFFRRIHAEMPFRPVHEGFEVKGKTARLENPINHYSYHSLHQYLEKINNYTSLDVLNKIGKGKVIRFYHFILNPLSAFLRMFFSLKGYRDGAIGFLLAWYSSFYVFLVHVKSWEYQKAKSSSSELPPVTSSQLNQLQ